MKLTKSSTPPALKKGQLWQTNNGQVEIMDVGKTLAHYRLFRNQKRVPTSLGRIQMVQDFLKNNCGELVRSERLSRAKMG